MYILNYLAVFVACSIQLSLALEAELIADVTEINPGVTATLNLICFLRWEVDNHDNQDERAESIVITKGNSKEVIAIIEGGTNTINQMEDNGVLSVSGSLFHNDLSQEPYLNLTLSYPTCDLQPEMTYNCDVNTSQSEPYGASASVSCQEPNVAEIIPQLVDLERQVISETQAVKDIGEDIVNINLTLLNMRRVLSDLRIPHTEEGIVTCGDSKNWPNAIVDNTFEVVKHVDFQQFYNETPRVLLALDTLDTDTDHNLRLHVFLKNVDSHGFDLVCNTWDTTHMYILNVRWVSVVS